MRVTPGGALVAEDGSVLLDWWVAAEDRWHTPAREVTCRQRLVERRAGRGDGHPRPGR